MAVIYLNTLHMEPGLENHLPGAGKEPGMSGVQTDHELNEVLQKQRSRNYLEQLLGSGLCDEYFSILTAITDPMRRVECRDSLLAREAYIMVSLNILSYINRWNIKNKISVLIRLDKLTDIDSHESWSSAADYLFTLSKILFELRNDMQEKKKSADIAIGYIQKYVRDHLDEELSLGRLADQVFLNPSYLSRLFKKTMGTNITDYIENIRITCAKSLLENDEVKIREVAKMLGYNTAASFTRFFRKSTGYTPQEYHELYLYGKIG